jgi:hypothetical protein
MPSANRRYSVRSVPTIYVRFDSKMQVFRQLPVDRGQSETFDHAEAVKRYGAENVGVIMGRANEWVAAGMKALH